MGTLSLVSEYLKDLEECMDDGDSRVAKEAKLFDALEHKSVVIEVDNQKIAIFTKAPLRAFGEPFMRYSLPCKVDGQGAWDAELDLADSANYVTEKVLENMGFVHVSLSDYGRKMVNDVNVEIHGVKFKADFVVLDYVNEGEPSILFGRDFLATTKSQVDFGLGEIRMNLTKFEEGIDVIDLLEEVGSSSEEVVKMGKANRNKGYNINKLTPPPSLRLEEIPPTSTIPPQPIYHPLTPKQKEKMKEVLDIKYKELEESKPILEVLENYVMYKKKLDEILIGKERLNKKEFSEEDKVGIIEHGLPKKMCDPGNYVLPVKINGVVEMVALVDTGASAMGEVKNVRIQIGYQAYAVDLLILDIPVDPELPLLLGRPFLRTCGAIIDMGRGTLCIDDGVIRHTYFPKPRSKSYVEAFEMEGDDDWLGSFEVGRDEDGNVKYGPIAPLFINIEDDMERALAMEAYFNPFKNVIVFKKLVVFLGSLLVQLKNLDWGNEGYGTYKKIDGDGDRHARTSEDVGGCSSMRENSCLKKGNWITNPCAVRKQWAEEEHGGDDDYFTSAMPDFGGSSSGYAVGGSSREAGFNDDDMDDPRDKKLIGGLKKRKSKDRTLRRALCRPAEGIAARQRARLYCRSAQDFAAQQDHDVKFPPPIFTPKAVEISLQIQESVRTNLKEEPPLLELR
ncbi:hypothetical protein Tco_0296481 [Tanacetum coccineum]